MRSAYMFLAILAFTDGARILGLFPHTGKSHYMVFEPLLRALTERGHHVTVASFFPLKNPPANYTDVSLGDSGVVILGLESINMSYLSDSIKLPGLKRQLPRFQDLHMIGNLAVKLCEKVVDWPPLATALTKEYDLIITENFNSYCMLGLLHVYNVRAPIIGFSSCNLMPWTASIFGLTDNPSYIPLVTAQYTRQMTYLERLINTVALIMHTFWYEHEVFRKEQAIIENHFGRKIPHLEELSKNMSLLLVNTFHTLNGVRPLLPAIVEVGGIHLNFVKKPIPQVSRQLKSHFVKFRISRFK